MRYQMDSHLVTTLVTHSHKWVVLLTTGSLFTASE